MTNWVPMTRTTQLPSVTSVGGYIMFSRWELSVYEMHNLMTDHTG